MSFFFISFRFVPPLHSIPRKEHSTTATRFYRLAPTPIKPKDHKNKANPQVSLLLKSVALHQDFNTKTLLYLIICLKALTLDLFYHKNVGNIMAKYTKTSEELRSLIVQIRDKKLLGRGYGRIISEQLQIPQYVVRRASSGKKITVDVIEAIFTLAEKNIGITYFLPSKIETNHSEEELKDKLQFIRENDLLPRNYSRIVSEEIGCTMARVRQVSNLVFFNLDIANAIVNVVENSKEKELINRAKNILEQAP